MAVCTSGSDSVLGKMITHLCESFTLRDIPFKYGSNKHIFVINVVFHLYDRQAGG